MEIFNVLESVALLICIFALLQVIGTNDVLKRKCARCEQRQQHPLGVAGLGPIARTVVFRIYSQIIEARSNGFDRLLIGEFEQDELMELGSVKRRATDSGTSYEYCGPIKQIVEHLQKGGMRIEVVRARSGAYRVYGLI